MTTQRVSASYQEIIDLHTESDRVSILGFHTPANTQPLRMLQPFWEAYQKVKYDGCSMSLVPAARLPADPSQVSYEGGEAAIDPRDLLNPILFHGCHGNDMGSILNQFYAGEDGSGSDVDRYFSDSLDDNLLYKRVGDDIVYESLYYRALTDNTWLKAHPMRGFRKSMRPMVYRVAVNTSLNPSTNGARQPKTAAAAEALTPENSVRTARQYSTLGPNTAISQNQMLSTPGPGLQKTSTSGGVSVTNETTYSMQAWMTPGIMPLGWIDTREVNTGAGVSAAVTGQGGTDAQAIAGMYEQLDARYNLIPKVYMGMCLLPPAYKTEQYYRIVLNHHFSFAKYRGTSMRSNGLLGSCGPVTKIDPSDDSKGGFDYGDDYKGILDD